MDLSSIMDAIGNSQLAQNPGALMQNPMFMAGINLLGARGNNVGQNVAQGIQSAQQSQMGPLQAQILALQKQRLSNALNFNPADFMQASPGLLGQSSQAQQAGATQPAQVPAALGGIGAGQMMPPQAPQQVQAPTGPGATTGGIDLPGMMAAGLKAGYSPQDMGLLAQSMNPTYYAQLQALTKSYEPYTLAPGAIHVNPLLEGQGGATTENNNPPPMSQLGQIDALTKARDKYPVGSPQYTSLDSAIQKMNGSFDQQMQQARLDELRQNREITNDMHRQTMQNTQDQRAFENQQKLDSKVTGLAERINKSGFESLQTSINDFNNWAKQNPDLPGFGRVQGALPDWAVPDSAKVGRMLYNKLNNIELHNMFGARVTEAEISRMRSQMGTGLTNPADMVLKGVQGLQNNLNSVINNVAQGTDAQTLHEYNQRGLSSLQFPEPQVRNTANAPSQTIGVGPLQNLSISDIDAAIARKSH